MIYKCKICGRDLEPEDGSNARAYNETIIKRHEEQKKYCAYVNACHHMEGIELESFETAIDIFNTILDYKDSRERLEECRARVEEIKVAKRQQEIAKRQAEEEEELINEKWKRIVLIGGDL